MLSGSVSVPPVRPGGARRAALLLAVVAALAPLAPADADITPVPRGPAAAGTPAAVARTGLGEPPSHRDLGLPASVAAVLIGGVGWGLIRVHRLAPVDSRRKPSGHRRTVGR